MKKPNCANSYSHATLCMDYSMGKNDQSQLLQSKFFVAIQRDNQFCKTLCQPSTPLILIEIIDKKLCAE